MRNVINATVECLHSIMKDLKFNPRQRCEVLADTNLAFRTGDLDFLNRVLINLNKVAENPETEYCTPIPYPEPPKDYYYSPSLEGRKIPEGW